jgi:hypothetical protein
MASGAIPHYSDAAPPAPAGRVNAKVQQGAPYPGTLLWNGILYNVQFTDISWNLPNFGGVNAQVGTSYTVADSDQGKLVTLDNASPVAVTLPDTLDDHFVCAVENLNDGLATLTPASGTINGEASLDLAKGSGALLYFDGTNWECLTGGGSSGGGVNEQAGDYAALATDSGKLIAMNKATAVTLTLPAVPPSATWWIVVENVGAGALTVDPNGPDLDGAALTLTILQNAGLLVYTDGIDYFTSRGVSQPDEQVKSVDDTLALVQQTTYVEAEGGVSGITLTLPPVATNGRRVVVVKKVDSAAGGVTVKGDGAENIDGANTYVITSQYAFVALECDGSDWLIVGSSRALSGGATKGVIGITVDGGGGVVPTTGVKGYIRVPYSGTITGWTLFGDVPGSCQFDLKKSTFAGFPPTVSIVASDPPKLVAQQAAESATLTGWTLAITAGDVLSFNLVSVSTLSRITLEIQVNKTT